MDYITANSVLELAACVYPTRLPTTFEISVNSKPNNNKHTAAPITVPGNDWFSVGVRVWVVVGLYGDFGGQVRHVSSQLP